MRGRRLIGLLLTLVFIAGFIGWNIWLTAQPDPNLLVRSFGAVPLAGGAAIAWAFLVRDGNRSRRNKAGR